MPSGTIVAGDKVLSRQLEDRAFREEWDRTAFRETLPSESSPIVPNTGCRSPPLRSSWGWPSLGWPGSSLATTLLQSRHFRGCPARWAQT